MRRAILLSATIAFAIACSDNITEPVPDRTTRSSPVSFATSTTDDGLSITTDKDDYAPGDTVHFTGTGWQAGDTLDIVLVDDALTQETHTWSVTIAGDGTFQDSTYVVDTGDIGVTFTLTATSRATGRSLTVVFTDGNFKYITNPANLFSTLVMTQRAGTTCSGGGAPTSITLSYNTNSPTPLNTTSHYDISVPSVTGYTYSGYTSGGNVTVSPASAPSNNVLCIVTSANNGSGSIEFDYLDNTSTTLAHTPAATNVGQAVTFTATVTDHLGAAIGNKGAVTFYEFATGQTCAAPGGATALAGPVTLANNPSGQASFQTSSLAAGTHTITACYGGTADYTTSSGSVAHTVTAAITGTNLAVNPATGIYGGQVSLSATLKAGTTALSNRSVAFTLNGNAVGSAPTDANGVATLSNVFLSTDGTASGTRITANTYATGVGATYAGEAGPPAFGNSSGTAQLKVDPKSVTPSITANSKVYDGNTSATIATRSLTGAFSGDNVSLTGGTASFADKNVGTGKVVTGTGLALSGTAAGNYSLTTTTATTTADITQASLVPAFTASNKVYDGVTSATITGRSLTGVLGTDDVTLTGGTATFSSKNVGTHTVTGTGFNLSGTDAGNYKLDPQTATTTASITRRALAVIATGIDKQYDGTTAASVTLDDDRIAGDVLTVSYTSAAFLDKNVGTAKHISVSGISISGTDAGNYILNSTTASATADITARPLTVTAVGVNKVYDGTNVASVTLSDDRVSGDLLSLTYVSATFDDKNVGTGKAISVTGISVTGTDAGNYSWNTSASATANITQRPITVTAASDTKVYDGNTSSDETPGISYGSLAGSDQASFTQTFNNKNVGTGKTLTPAGTVNDGNSGNNYKVTFANNTSGEITPRALVVTATGQNKQYDGTTAATVSLSDDRIAGDILTLGYTSATFSDKNVGTGKIISVSGISVTGTDAGNYTHNNTATASADISKRPITVVASAADKYWDGNTNATVTLSATDALAGDNVTPINYSSATFADANVGSGKTVTVYNLSLAGTDGGNYDPNPPTHTATTTASILAWTLAGFYQPVDMPTGSMVWNTVKGGSTVPLKFEVFIGSAEQTNTNVVKNFQVMGLTCSSVGTLAEIDLTTTGGTVLRYDGTAGQFIQNWQTPKQAGSCYKVTVFTQDGSSKFAYFMLK
jgi:YDG domain/Bacterial Ig-like domain (group 3)